MSKVNARWIARTAAILLMITSVKLGFAQRIVGVIPPDAPAKDSPVSIARGPIFEAPIAESPIAESPIAESTIAPAPLSESTIADVASPSQFDSASRDTNRPCVLLRNDNVLFGTASQMGQYVIVRRGPENEIRLPRTEVACWADNLRNLYRYRVDHRPEGDLQAILKDARWCMRYDLFDVAQQEIQFVLGVDGKHVEAQRMQAQLQRLLTPVASTSVDEKPQVRRVAYDRTSNPHGSVSPDLLREFAGAIQPMLVNRCGQCHSHDSDRPWTLTTPSAGMRASARMTRENLTTTLKFVDRFSPEQSELWVRAVTPHGGVAAGLEARQGKAMAALKRWIDSVAANAREDVHDSASPTDQAVTGFPGFPSDSNERSAPRSVDPVTSSAGPNSAGVRGHAPARLPEIENPFDAELFNRRYHPE